MKKQEYVQICPKCNSRNIEHDLSNPALVNSGMSINYFVCRNCNHHGSFFPEVLNSKIPKLKKAEKPVLVNANYVRNINWWWRIAGPIGLILGIILLFLGLPLMVFSLLDLLPVSILTTLNAYSDKLRKNKVFKSIFIIGIIYFFTIGPIISAYIISLFYY